MYSNKSANKPLCGYSKKLSTLDSLQPKSQLKPTTFSSYISSQSPYPNSPTSKSSKGISSKPQVCVSEPNESLPSLQKFILMQDMVAQLLDKYSVQNREVNDGLFYLLSVIQNITKPKYKDQIRLKPQPLLEDRKYQASLIDESTKVNSTLTKLIEISKTREIKEELYAIKQVQDRPIRQIDIQKFTSSPKLEYKGSNNTSRKSYKVKESEAPEVITLKQQKIKLMAELNREIELSNMKSEEIKHLQFQVSRLQREREEPHRLQRCLSGTISSRNMYDQEQKEREKFKDEMILRLQRELQDLRRQNRQLKEFSISQSFISEAFNFRQNQMTSQKQHYEGIIKELKTRLEELESKSVNHTRKRSGTDFYKHGDTKGEEQKTKLLREIEYYRESSKSLGLEVATLRNQVYTLKEKLEGKNKYPQFKKKQTYREA